MKLTFAGGAGSVTGACYLLQEKETNILIDCGLNQGGSENEKKNFDPFPFDPKIIEAVFVTHTHIDHIGRIPKLVKDGFSGTIYSTAPTKDAAYHLLIDAHHIMLNDLPKDQNPLYDLADIDRSMELWRVVTYHKPISVGAFVVEAYDAGHILGSASYKITGGGKAIVFSGDLGNIPAPLVKKTEYIKEADYALIESAYGNRIHEDVAQRVTVLEDMIEDVVRSKGTLVIPSFAMERTQDLLYELNKLVEEGRIPKIPIFIDSPLAIRLTETYKKYERDPVFLDQKAVEAVRKGDAIFNFPGLRFTLTTEESKEINSVPPPKVVIAGAGMSNGGRILHHEVRYLSDPQSAILFVGFQPEGSLGRLILDGAKEVRIMGQTVPIRARVKAIGGFSAHADQPLLLAWIESMKDSLKKVFVVQGEEDQSTPLAHRIKDVLAIEAVVPKLGDSIEL